MNNPYKIILGTFLFSLSIQNLRAEEDATVKEKKFTFEEKTMIKKQMEKLKLKIPANEMLSKKQMTYESFQMRKSLKNMRRPRLDPLLLDDPAIVESGTKHGIDFTYSNLMPALAARIDANDAGGDGNSFNQLLTHLVLQHRGKEAAAFEQHQKFLGVDGVSYTKWLMQQKDMDKLTVQIGKEHVKVDPQLYYLAIEMEKISPEIVKKLRPETQPAVSKYVASTKSFLMDQLFRDIIDGVKVTEGKHIGPLEVSPDSPPRMNKTLFPDGE